MSRTDHAKAFSSGMATKWSVVLAIIGLGGVALAWWGLPRDPQPPRRFSVALGSNQAETAIGTQPERADETAPERDTTDRVGAARKPAARVAESPSLDKQMQSRDLLRAVAWLRAVLPDRFGSLTTADAIQLVELDLQGAVLSDEDLVHLLAFPALHAIGLRGTAITDEAIVLLRQLPHLELLDLRDTALSGEALSLLPQRLHALNLTSTNVSGEDLLHLPAMPELRTLKLNFLSLDDADIEAVNVYPSLVHAELDGTGLTDVGLGRLLALNPGLERIEVRNTQVTKENVAALAVAYPNCEIVFEQAGTATAALFHRF